MLTKLLPCVVVAGAACGSGSSSTPTAPIENSTKAESPHGTVLWYQHATEAGEAVVGWSDLDRGASGTLPHDLGQALVPTIQPTTAIWAFETHGDHGQLLMFHQPSGAGDVIATPVPGGWLHGIDRDNRRAAFGCTNIRGCGVHPIGTAGLGTRVAVGDGLPDEARVDLEAWLPDGRMVFQQRTNATVWFVDPGTGVATQGPRLAGVFDAITDDASLVVRVEGPNAAPDHNVRVAWRGLGPDAKETAIVIPSSRVDCLFTPVTRVLVCAVSPPLESDHADSPKQHRLVTIDPASGKLRELATDLATANTVLFARSPDGRFVAAGVRGPSGTQIVAFDVIGGARHPIGPAAYDAYPIGWIASR